MKRNDLTTPTAYLQLPQLPPSTIQWRWFDDFWDGPLSGLVHYQDQPYWCEAIPEDDVPRTARDYYRRYLVIKLTPQQLQEEEHWHALFRQYVGTHTDVDGTPWSPAKLRPHDEWPHFYEAYQQRTPQDLTHNIVIGWFET